MRRFKDIVTNTWQSLRADDDHIVFYAFTDDWHVYFTRIGDAVILVTARQ
jgi:hypothetical protein